MSRLLFFILGYVAGIVSGAFIGVLMTKCWVREQIESARRAGQSLKSEDESRTTSSGPGVTRLTV